MSFHDADPDSVQFFELLVYGTPQIFSVLASAHIEIGASITITGKVLILNVSNFIQISFGQ